jgi:GT2 family glycosyltransferase
MTMLGAVIPVAPGRRDNLIAVLSCLAVQDVDLAAVVIVEDGPALAADESVAGLPEDRALLVKAPKHQPGMEQPRNLGVRMLRAGWPQVTHVWFLDSDVIVEPDAAGELLEAIDVGPQDRIVVAPYDWLAPGQRPAVGDLPLAYHQLRNDPRWPMFDNNGPERVFRGDLSAGLACFSGNLVWPLNEFERVGGFWNELHHGRCEDGELGLRAVAMDVGISFTEWARGWHLWHEVDLGRVRAMNERDVPLINARHPWVQGADVFVVDRDGKAFDVRCRCGETVPTIGWWRHAQECSE